MCDQCFEILADRSSLSRHRKRMHTGGSNTVVDGTVSDASVTIVDGQINTVPHESLMMTKDEVL